MRSLFILILVVFTQFGFAQKGNSLIRRGNSDYEKKRYKDSEINYRSSLNKDPQSFAGNYNLGNSLYKQGKFEDANKQYLQSSGLSKNPKELSQRISISEIP